MARVTRSAAPEQAPLLEFFPHRGKKSLFQPRIVEPRAHTTTDKMKISTFPRIDDDSDEEIVIKSFVAGFQIIEKDIAPLLLDELVKFLVDTWRQDQRHGFEKPSTPKDHRFYDILTSEDKTTKSLNFGYWFYFAAWWGPGHPDLRTIREQMSVIWGIEFPADAIFYPTGISDKQQKRLYAGIGPEFEAEASGSPGGHPTPRPRAPSRAEASTQQAAPKAQALSRPASQTRDTKMEARQQEIINAIENNPVGSVLGKFVPNINPKFLKSAASANDNNLSKLKFELSATHKELQESNTKVDILEANLEGLQTAHDAAQVKLQQVEEKVENLESGLERVQEENKHLEDEKTQLAECVDKLEGNLKRANKHASDLDIKLSKADDRMDILERKLEEANERAKKAIEMSAFNHALIEKRLKEESPEEEDE